MTIRTIPVAIGPPREDDDLIIEPPPSPAAPAPLSARVAWRSRQLVTERPIAA